MQCRDCKDGIIMHIYALIRLKRLGVNYKWNIEKQVTCILTWSTSGVSDEIPPLTLNIADDDVISSHLILMRRYGSMEAKPVLDIVCSLADRSGAWVQKQCSLSPKPALCHPPPPSQFRFLRETYIYNQSNQLIKLKFSAITKAQPNYRVVLCF